MSDEKKPLNRRSFMNRIMGSGVALGALTVFASPAAAQRYTGLTNSDPGDRPNYGRTGLTNSDPSDPAGWGRRGGRGGGRRCSGLTDSDGGRNRDAPGCGRGRRATGITDRDSSDRAGNGRGRRASGVTDSDPSDRAGNGRGRRYTGRSDSDGGTYADRGGYGR